MATKRTIENFFQPAQSKKPRLSNDREEKKSNHVPSSEPPSNHGTYPWPIPQLPPHIAEFLSFAPEADGKEIKDKPDLDLLYFHPFVPRKIEKDLFNFLRRELFFYRVKYTIKRGSVETLINTPRYTTVFGVDATSYFSTPSSSSSPSSPPSQAPALHETATDLPVARTKYPTCTPRPIPHSLALLQRAAEAATGCTFNFCLVNYYASGRDSISYHSDDERFLGAEPAIASFSLGSARDFLMKHKPAAEGAAGGKGGGKEESVKFKLQGGDMVLMRGRTQSCWLHSIPKRAAGGEADGGRINITFRKAVVKEGTANYYRYNVGEGEVYKWDEKIKEMAVWKKPS